MIEFKEVLPCGVELVVFKHDNGSLSIRIIESSGMTPRSFTEYAVGSRRAISIYSNEENADALRRAFDFIYPVRQSDWLDKIIHWFSGSKP